MAWCWVTEGWLPVHSTVGCQTGSGRRPANRGSPEPGREAAVPSVGPAAEQGLAQPTPLSGGWRFPYLSFGWKFWQWSAVIAGLWPLLSCGLLGCSIKTLGAPNLYYCLSNLKIPFSTMVSGNKVFLADASHNET